MLVIGLVLTSSLFFDLTAAPRFPALAVSAGVCTPAPDDMVSWWPAEGIDPVTNDIADGNNGTLENGATQSGAGKVGTTSFSFDGTDDQVSVPHNDNLEGGAITIDAWVFLDTMGHGRPIANKRAGTVGGYTFETLHGFEGVNSGLQWVVWVDGAAYPLYTPSDVLTTGVWHHVAATFDGSGSNSVMSIYVHGVLQASRSNVPAGSITSAPTAPFVIGRNQAISSYAWDGLLDEIEVFSRALNATEVEAIFLADDAGKCRQDGTPTPTEAPTPTPTPTASPTPTPTLATTPTPETPTPTPGPETPTPTLGGETPTPTPTGQPTPSPTPSPTPVGQTPSPTPTPGGTDVLVWGDNNCSGEADPVDSLLALRHDAGLSANTGDCPAMGQEVDVVAASIHLWGDIDCSDTVDPIDALKLLRYDAGLSVSPGDNCPGVGTEVEVQT